MRQTAVFALVTALLILSACSNKRTILTSHGSETVETNPLHNTVKVTNRQGTAIIGRGAVDPKALGLPLYPGAIQSKTGGLEETTSAGTVSHVVSLVTTDAFNEVYGWYKGRMPAGSEQTHMQAQAGSVASFTIGALTDKDQKSVVITQSGAGTTILLTHVTKRR